MCRKRGWSLYIGGRDVQITTGAKLLGITYESYGFSGDLTETIK